MDNKKNRFSIKEAISFGWASVNENLLFFISVSLGVIILILGLDVLANNFKETNPLLETLFNVLGTIVNVVLTLGFTKLSLLAYKGDKPHISIIFSQTKYFFRYFFASILYGIITLLGLALLVVPGIIWGVRFRFFGYAIVDKDTGIINSLKESYRLTKGLTWKIFVFSLAIFGINILGLIAAGVGLLVTIPISIIAIGYVWQKIKDFHTEAIIVQPKELNENNETVVLV